MSEVDKRCIYASSEHLKMINLFISYDITENNVSLLMCEAPRANQDLSVCYGEKRRYELLSMIEQSDIIRAISLPNARAEGMYRVG